MLRDLPVIYLYNATHRFGVSKAVGGVQVFGDSRTRVAFAGFKT